MALDRQPSSHPILEGREIEARALSDAVRRLIDLSVTNTAPLDETVKLTNELNLVADRLEQYVPKIRPPRYVMPKEESPDALMRRPPLGSSIPFDFIVGTHNPLALPVVLEFDPPKAIGRACFSAPYEGAPGCVHGAAIAGTFDIVLTAANSIDGLTGPTVNLSVDYLKPTLVDEEAVFEAWVESRTTRRVYSRGRIIQNGVVTVEASGEFAQWQRGEVSQLSKYAKHRKRQVESAD